MRPAQSYPILRIVASLLVAVGILITVAGFVVGPVITSRLYTPPANGLPPADANGYRMPATTTNMDGTSWIISLAIIIASTLLGFSLIANGEMILLFINIQADTSVIRQLVENE